MAFDVEKALLYINHNHHHNLTLKVSPYKALYCEALQGLILTACHHSSTVSEHSLLMWKVRKVISQPSQTLDIKMISCHSQCVAPHQWIAQRHVCPISVYCITE